MTPLHALQRDFAAALRDTAALPDAARWLAGDPALAGRRLGIYRANVAAVAARALGAAYPVARQVVGDEFFDALARAHQAAHPSTSGDLHDFGAGFADFVAAFPHTRALPWLPDLCRLEWAVHRAYGAADAEPVDPQALAAVPPDALPSMRLRWAPGTAVVASAFPIVRVWCLHPAHPADGAPAEGSFDVDWSQAQRALVGRNGWRVGVDELAPGEAAFVAASLGGATFEDAAGAALEAAADTDLGRLLGRVLAAGLVCGFDIPEGS